MLTAEEIQRIISEDYSSEKKLHARKGQSYYEGEHDIKDYRLFYYNDDGILVEDKYRANYRIPHAFFAELVDQAVQYMLSGDEYIKSDIPELQQELDDYFNCNEDFSAELSETLTGCIAKGFEYMYAYKNSEDRISFQCADSLGVVEVRSKDTDSDTDCVIYKYIDRIEKGYKKIAKIQVWDKEQVYYFVQSNDGKIEKDESEKINPRPHTLYSKGEKTYFKGFGFIPFFRLDNNKKQITGLKAVKDLIDDYDQTWERDLPNSLEDLNGSDWDCVMTIPENQWGYHAEWRGYVKTSYDLLEMMVKAVSLNGNFVLNFGPDGKGNIRSEETKLAKEIGDWMKINKEAIYGTSHSTVQKQDWGYFTQKGNKLYMCVFNRPINNLLKIEIPKGGIIPMKAYFLENNQETEIQNAGKNKRNSSLYHVAVPASYKTDRPFVIVLEMQENTKEEGEYQQAKI